MRLRPAPAARRARLPQAVPRQVQRSAASRLAAARIGSPRSSASISDLACPAARRRATRFGQSLLPTGAPFTLVGRAPGHEPGQLGCRKPPRPRAARTAPPARPCSHAARHAAVRPMAAGEQRSDHPASTSPCRRWPVPAARVDDDQAPSGVATTLPAPLSSATIRHAARAERRAATVGPHGRLQRKPRRLERMRRHHARTAAPERVWRAPAALLAGEQVQRIGQHQRPRGCAAATRCRAASERPSPQPIATASNAPKSARAAVISCG